MENQPDWNTMGINQPPIVINDHLDYVQQLYTLIIMFAAAMENIGFTSI